jgi:poly-gamma-glutamate capsule biosynthesis protein CapA/YwtB (metallophosphatase superfamily)
MTAAPIATIAFVGDLVPSRAIPDPLPAATAEVFALLHGADLAFGDLEMPMSDRGHPQEKFIAFGGSPALAAELPKIGVDVVSLATNHSMDQGPLAMLDTIGELEKLGIETLGAGADLASAERLVVREIGGATVGFLAWTCLVPSGAGASPLRPGLAPIHVHTAYEVDPYVQMEEPGNPPRVRTRPDQDDLTRAAAAVQAARGEVDFLVVSMHWGFGSTSELAEYQPTVGHALIDAGADLVLGAHVHAVQPIERYRDRLIAYGVGNFVAQQPREGLSAAAIQLLDEMSKDAMVAVLAIEGDGEYELTLTPVIAGDIGLPEIPAASETERILTGLVDESGVLDTEIAVQEGSVGRVRGHWDAARRRDRA